jgi:tetratricopeptide (TPR) repeat protein
MRSSPNCGTSQPVATTAIRAISAFLARLCRLARVVPPVLALVLVLAAPPTARADDVGDADLLLRAGHTDQALEKIDAYLAKNPQDMQARFLKGIILTEQKRETEAIDVFLRLTQDNPEYAEPYNNLAVLYAARGNLEGARNALETAVRVNPKYVTAQENLGDVYARLAVRAYERAEALGTKDKTVGAKLKLSRELIAVGEGADGRKNP